VWAQIVATVLGVWVTAAPGVLGYGGRAAASDHIFGPVIATFACVAAWEATRAVRWVNLPLGLWVALAPWLLGGPWQAAVGGTAAGLAVAALSCVRGDIRERFGGGWSALWRARARDDPT
jgi:hypothetical protein